MVDPVIRSSSGRELLAPEGVTLLRERLLPLASWVTPNLDELSLLSGVKVATPADVVLGSQVLRERYPDLHVLATGGHLERPDDLLMAPGCGPEWIQGERIESTSTHGTGCALSSALLSRLVLGEGPLEAAQGAKRYVAEAIRRAEPLGYGKGPLNHLWPLK